MSIAPTATEPMSRRKPRILPGWQRSATYAAASFLLLGSFALTGCTSPSAANIALRKQVQTQQDEIEKLKRQHAADVADDAVQPNSPGTTQPISLSQAQGIYTVHGVRFGKLSRADAKGLTLHVIPTDDDGEDFKAAGSIKVEAFDLSADGKRVAEWTFSTADAKSKWNGNALRYEYVLPCPWPSTPAGKEWTVKVTFTDALTGRTFSAQQSYKRSD